MEYRWSNEDVYVGQIFMLAYCDEVGYYSTFYKVVEKRGKTIVIIRQVNATTTGKKVENGVEIKALPDEVIGEPIKTRAYISYFRGKKTVLHDKLDKRFDRYFYPREISYRSGWYSCDPNKGRLSTNLLEEALP